MSPLSEHPPPPHPFAHSTEPSPGGRGRRTPLRGVLVFAAGLLGGGCGPSPWPARPVARLLLPQPVLVFDDLVRGGGVEKTLLLGSAGTRDLELVLGSLVSSSATFAVRLDDAVVPPGQQARLTVTMTGTQLGPATGHLELVTNDPDRPRLTLELLGRVVPGTLRSSPEPLVFAPTVLGRTRTSTLTVTAGTDVVFDVRLDGGDEVQPCAEPAPRAATFCVEGPGVDTPLALEAGATAALAVRFSPRRAGTAVGTMDLRTCPDPRCASTVVLQGRGLTSPLACAPVAVDFGPVRVGETASAQLECENVSADPVRVTEWRLAGTATAAFGLRPSGRLPLEPEARFALPVDFRPDRDGPLDARVELSTADPAGAAHPTLVVALRGSGDGSVIRVEPEGGLDFGRVSLLAPARRPLRIINAGPTPLRLADVVVDTAGTGAFRSPDVGGDVLAPGGSRTLVVEHQPLAEGPVRSAVTLRREGGAPITIPLRGEGVRLPPCRARLASTLDFGAVLPGRSLRLGLAVRNEGDDPCLLTGVRLLPGSDGAFDLPGDDVRSVEVGPGRAVAFDVGFAPRVEAPVQARLELGLSDPSAPYRTVSLLGRRGSNALLLERRPGRFGPRPVGCESDREVTLRNLDAASLAVQRIDLVPDADPAFAIVDLPGPIPDAPLVLPPGGETSFTVRFSARPGPRAAAVEISGRFGDRPVHRVLPLHGEGTPTAEVREVFAQPAGGAVDLLVVSHKGAAMTAEQQALQRGTSSLLRFARDRGVDFGIGVTTTDLQEEAGRLVSADPTLGGYATATGPAGHRIVVPGTLPSPDDALARNLELYFDYAWWPSALDAAWRALSPTVLLGRNTGFLRPEAILSVLFLSDEPDFSPGDVARWVELLRSTKIDPHRVIVSAIVAPEPSGSCSGPNGQATGRGRYHAAVEATGGEARSICTADWGPMLEAMSPRVFGQRSRWLLAGQPASDRVEVDVDGVPVPATDPSGTVRWTYDPEARAVDFADAAIPEPGARIEVRYASACR